MTSRRGIGVGAVKKKQDIQVILNFFFYLKKIKITGNFKNFATFFINYLGKISS